MRTPLRGEVYTVGLGLVAKAARALFSAWRSKNRTDLWSRSFLTKRVSGNPDLKSPYRPKLLKPGAFDAQGTVTGPTVRLMNGLGTLSTEQIRAVEKGVCLWLGIDIAA